MARGKMDPMRAKALASRMRKQYPRATTGQLKGMLETGQPMNRSELEGYRPVPGMTRSGYQGVDSRPISEMSEQELYARGITPDRPMQDLRRMESSAAYGESDPMTGMTDSDAFPESLDLTHFAGVEDKYQIARDLERRRRASMDPSYIVPKSSTARGDFMEDLTQSTDYGNAYTDTIATRRPDTFKSVDDLAEVPMMYDTAIEKGFGLYNRMGKVPPSVAVEIGRLAGLMDVKRAMEDIDAESLRQSMLDDRRGYIEGKEVQPAIDDFGDRNAR
tara:strand:- start:60 stop:884 length:825 start_codon:yes stop_codon:yes gene_type:complete